AQCQTGWARDSGPARAVEMTDCAMAGKFSVESVRDIRGSNGVHIRWTAAPHSHESEGPLVEHLRPLMPVEMKDIPRVIVRPIGVMRIAHGVEVLWRGAPDVEDGQPRDVGKVHWRPDAAIEVGHIRQSVIAVRRVADGEYVMSRKAPNGVEATALAIVDGG